MRRDTYRKTAPAGDGYLIKAYAVAAFCAFVSLAIPFVTIYLRNREHFQVRLSEHLDLLILISGGIFLLLVALQVLLQGRARRAVTLVLFVVGCLAWINGVVLVGDYGYFDGSAIDWSSHKFQLTLELATVAAMVGITVWKRQWVYDNLLFLTILMSSLALAPAIVSKPATEAGGDGDYVFTKSGVVELSQSTNVVLIVVDTMQSDVFAEIFGSDERWLEVFDGFTYFANSLSPFPKTYASVPALLTGRMFGNEQPVKDYLYSAYFSGSLPQRLTTQGFDVRLWPYRIQPLIAHPALARNVASASGEGADIEAAASAEFYQILDLVAFRLAPVTLKPWVYNDGEFRLVGLLQPTAGPAGQCSVASRYSAGNDHHDLTFLDWFNSCSKRRLERPAFRFYHLSGAHQPFVLDAELNHHKPAPRTREAFIRHSEGALAVLRELLRRLKTLDAYEQSMIVIVGDHGGGELGVGVNPRAHPSLDIESRYEQLTPHVSTPDLIAGAIPLILVKRPGASGLMKVSDAPVQLTDVPATIFAEFGIDRPIGRSMFEIAEDEHRPRLHRHYRFAGWSLDYVLPMIEFLVDGHSWDAASWSLTGTDLNPPTERTNGGNYATLFVGGNPDRFLVDGWADPTIQGVSLQNSSGTLRLPGGFDDVGPPLRITLVHQPLRAEQVERVALDVYVNRQPLDSWTIRPGSRRVSGLLPRKSIGSDPFELTFRARSADAKQLVFHEVVVEQLPVPKYTLSTVLDFSNGGNAEQYQVTGFSHQERWGTWSLGERSLMLFKLDQANQALKVRIKAAGFVTEELASQTVQVLANGRAIATAELTKRRGQYVEFMVPAEAIADDHLLLEFRFPNSASPHELGRSADTRPLAMGFISLTMSNAD